MEGNSTKYKQISRVRSFPFLPKITSPFFLLFFLFFTIEYYFILFLFIISQWMTLYTRSGLFNRQGLDTVYENYFVLLLSSPLSTIRHLSIETLRPNRKALGLSLGIDSVYYSHYHDVYGTKENVCPVANSVGW